MRNCKGLHCDGCRHGAGAGAGIGALVLLLGVLLLAAHHRAIAHAASDTVHVVADVLAVAAVTAAAVALAAGSVWAVRARQRARSRATAPLTAWVVRPCAAPERPAIESTGRPELRVLPGWQHDFTPAVRGALSNRRARGEQDR